MLTTKVPPPATAAHLNTFLRALATYALGPYIRQNILETVTSLSAVKREFMKLLEIDVSDSTFMDFYSIRRRANERPLMFYHRLRYHAERHLLQAGDRVGGAPLQRDEQFSPTLERMIILEWLRRIDERLVKFIQEKFATELNVGRSTLLALVESLAKNIDTYLSGLNRGASVGVTTYPTEPPVTQHTDQHQYSGGEYQGYAHHDQGYHQQVGDVGYGYAARGRGFQFQFHLEVIYMHLCMPYMALFNSVPMGYAPMGAFVRNCHVMTLGAKVDHLPEADLLDELRTAWSDSHCCS